MASLAGAEAVITGAARGLGRAMAVALASEGARVSLCDRSEQELDATVSLIERNGGSVCAARVDLGDTVACDDFVNLVTAEVRRLHVLVNNAAVWPLASVERQSVDDWSETLAVNLTAPFILTRGLLPSLRREGGSVINVSSRAGIMAFEKEAAYCASKFGLEALTKCLALELVGSRVSVNTITPGLCIKPTSLTDAQEAALPASERARWSAPDAIMPAVLLLARLRGEVSGLRFDALRLAEALLSEEPGPTMARLGELAE